MIPKISHEPGVNGAAAPVSAAVPSTASPSRASPGSIVARIAGVAIALVGNEALFFGVLNLNSTVTLLVAFGAVAMIAAVLFHSWWALLIVPLVNMICWIVTSVGVFILAGLSHGAEIHNLGELVVSLFASVLLWGTLPALLGALAGTLAWRGWERWRGR